MSKEFLKKEEIKIGSQWRAPDGGKYGCTIFRTATDTDRDVYVLGTDGKYRYIDFWKLQYRYYLL